MIFLSVVIISFLCATAIFASALFFIGYAKKNLIASADKTENLLKVRNNSEKNKLNIFQYDLSKSERKANLIMSVFELSKDIQKTDNILDFVNILRTGLSNIIDFDSSELIITTNEDSNNASAVYNVLDLNSGTCIDKTHSSSYNFFSNKYKESDFKENDVYLFYPEKNQHLLYNGFASECKSIFFPMISFDINCGALFIKREKKEFESFEINSISILVKQISLIFRNIQLLNTVNNLIICDIMTGLFVHKYFRAKLEEEILRYKTSKKTFCILICDIDHFKIINDSYGHQAGDIVLKETGKILKESVRTVDMPARYGGDEFSVILPHTSLEGAMILANRICEKIRKTVIPFYNKTLEITISIGVSEFNDSAANSSELIKKADAALYYCKRNGRNQAYAF